MRAKSPTPKRLRCVESNWSLSIFLQPAVSATTHPPRRPARTSTFNTVHKADDRWRGERREEREREERRREKMLYLTPLFHSCQPAQTINASVVLRALRSSRPALIRPGHQLNRHHSSPGIRPSSQPILFPADPSPSVQPLQILPFAGHLTCVVRQ